jgi:hypothetical protein
MGEEILPGVNEPPQRIERAQAVPDRAPASLVSEFTLLLSKVLLVCGEAGRRCLATVPVEVASVFQKRSSPDRRILVRVGTGH